MDYTGLSPRFKNNRPLSPAERAHQLKQKKRLDVPLAAELCVVKMNSNSLLSVDRWFSARGFLALIGAILMGVAVVGIGMLAQLLIFGLPNENGLWTAVFISIFMLAALGALGVYVAGKEMYRWTYYPIMLDRKNRFVHVFRLDGTTLSVPWDKVFFTLGQGKGLFGMQNWDIRGLVLDADGVTVKETFAFSTATSPVENVISHWEFLRRYMEEGPQAVIQEVKFCMPVDGKRESFAVGKERIFAEDTRGGPFFYLTMMPFNYLHAIMRWAVMRTSKIPAFPEPIEASVRPDPNDMYTRDASINPEDLR